MSDSFDAVAATAAGISALALLVSVYAAVAAKKVATSDFQAVEKVKLDTARLIAVLRSLMIKGIVYTQQDDSRRDDPAFESFVDIGPERRAIEEFLHSSTALAYYSFVAKRSKRARAAGVESEAWRVFFLHLGDLLQTANPWVAANAAGALERQFEGIGESEMREIAEYMSDLPAAIALLFSEREHDVLIQATVTSKDGPVSENNFMEFVRFLREKKGVDDPDLDVFWAASSGDNALLEAAHRRGANLQVRTGALIRRYEKYASEFQDYLAGERDQSH